MHVVERGEGVPLILLHGFAVDHRMLLPLDPVFESAGEWRRLYFDLPATEGTPLGLVASAEDVVCMVEDEIRQLVGTGQFAILGNSFGGMIARRVVHDLRPQVLGLATLAGVFVAERERRVLPPRTILRQDSAVLARLGAAAEEFARIAVVQDARTAGAFAEHDWPGLASADQAGLAVIAERYALDREPEDASPEPFTQPCLFIAARQDHMVGYEDAWARIEHYPRATFAVLDAAGHNVHQEQPELTRAFLTDWLHRITALPGMSCANDLGQFPDC